MTIQPPFLQPGDTIGMVCPSGYMPIETMQTCLQVLAQWGFTVKQGKTLGTHFNYFSGTDEERLADLQEMMDDHTVKAILCARGGYGLSRIVDRIDFDTFRQQPKWIAGFSDITVLHAHLYRHFRIASIHSPMAAAFNNEGYLSDHVTSLRNVLCGLPAGYHCEGYKLNRHGSATGDLVGGNLALLVHLVGTPGCMDLEGKILFIEDVGEYIYNIDRMMLQLKRAGMLVSLAGLVVGKFSDTKDTVIPFGESVYDAIWDKVKDYQYPVCFDFPVGHVAENYALKHGIAHTLTVTATVASLTEKS